MKNLMLLRTHGTEPGTIAVNLTGQPIKFDADYIADPDGSAKSLLAAHVVIVVDFKSTQRGVDALNKILAIGVLSLAIENIESRGRVWIFQNGEHKDLEINFPEKRIGIFTMSELKEYAGDDWDDIKDSPEQLKTFSYLVAGNRERLAA